MLDERRPARRTAGTRCRGPPTRSRSGWCRCRTRACRPRRRPPRPLPERIELGQRERAPASAEVRNRRGPDQDDLGAALDEPLELLDRASTMGSVMTGHREDPIVDVEAPVLEHPLVEARGRATWVATGSSVSRSSRTLASVGHMSARSMPSSFISSIRASGSKKAGGAGDRTRRRHAAACRPAWSPSPGSGACT